MDLMGTAAGARRRHGHGACRFASACESTSPRLRHRQPRRRRSRCCAIAPPAAGVPHPTSRRRSTARAWTCGSCRWTATRPTLLVAAGGDGTINAVAGVVRGTGTALGILPFGTLNHFAKDLHIPLDPAEAARVIAAGKRMAVDVGEVNGRIFINNASLGLYPGMVKERDRQQRRLRRSKRHAMVWATLAVLQRPPVLDLRLDLDGEVHDYRAPYVFIGNNVYRMEGFDIGTRERVDEGCLSVYTTRAG